MRIDKITDTIKESLLWIYIAAVIAGTIYAACMGQTTKSPGEIIYERNHDKPYQQ